MLDNITIGADPELFIINTKTGNVVSAVGMIPGEKGNPYRSDDMPEGFGLETDNILAEFNIPPVNKKEDFIDNILFMQKYIDKFVKNIDPDFGIECISSRIVPDSELKTPQAKEFGCSVDYNVYTCKANPKPKGTSTNLRSSGLHIHIGYDNPNIEYSTMLIKYLDAYLGVPSILIDQDTKRRSLYGKAGCFRLCGYGCEYRVLSSTMMNSIENLEFVWRQLIRAIAAFEFQKNLPQSRYVTDAINNSDINLANKLIKEYKLM